MNDCHLFREKHDFLNPLLLYSLFTIGIDLYHGLVLFCMLLLKEHCLDMKDHEQDGFDRLDVNIRKSKNFPKAVMLMNIT